MKDAGISTADISRFSGHLAASTDETNSLIRSYLTNPPVNCIVQRAGGDPTKTQHHQPPYSMVPVPEDLLREDPRFAALLDQRDSIHTQYNACRTRKDRMAKQLYAAKGSIDSMIHEIKRVFQVCASRPVHPISLVTEKDSPSIQEIAEYRFGWFQPILTLPLFESERYKIFRSQIRSLEDATLGIVVPSVPPPFRISLSEHSVNIVCSGSCSCRATGSCSGCCCPWCCPCQYSYGNGANSK
jgi:hypothetical protein